MHNILAFQARFDSTITYFFLPSQCVCLFQKDIPFYMIAACLWSLKLQMLYLNDGYATATTYAFKPSKIHVNVMITLFSLRREKFWLDITTFRFQNLVNEQIYCGYFVCMLWKNTHFNVYCIEADRILQLL